MMLRSTTMVHMRIQVPSADAAAATRAIAGVGLLHLVDIAHGTSPYDAAPPGTRELYAAFRDLSSRIRLIAGRLGIQLAEPVGAIAGINISDYAAERERIALVLEPLEKRVESLAREEAALRERLSHLEVQLGDSVKVRAAALDIARLTAVRFATVRAGIGAPDSLAAMATVLAPAPFAIVPLSEDGGSVFFVATIANFARGRLDEAFRICSVRPADLAGAAEVETLTTKARQTEAALAGVRARLDAEKNAIGDELSDLSRRAETATLLLQAQTYFAAAGRFVVISGWVPASSADLLKEKIGAASGGRAIVDLSSAEAIPGVAEGTMRVPILHRNPLVLRPFQKLIEIYGTPSYEEVQPTAFFAISFLLMFGLMFGDVGHGLVLTSAGYLLFRHFPRFLDYGILLMEAGASSALFGFLYGSVFGIRDLLPALWLEPMEDLSRFMIVAIGLGVVVVSAGLVLNIVNAWRRKDFASVLIGPHGLTGALLYWVILVVVIRALVPRSSGLSATLIFALTLAALGLLVFGKKLARLLERRHHRPAPAVHAAPLWLGLLENSIELVDTLFSFFANTISFVRVAAFAAVHAGVFIAIFAIADAIADTSFGGVLSIAVHIAGNIIVILLEGLTVSVQVLRLEYYEFFGKFFRGGGETYRPLTMRTEEREVGHG
jgi:V/A-type H+/Na+-transporting ATPase subunit I